MEREINYEKLRKALKGTQSEKNLEAALIDEALARARYTYYAKSARADGYEQMESLFLDTADNERAHAEIWLRILDGGNLTTEEALKSAAIFEHQEWAKMYAKFAEVAKEEGFLELAEEFEGVARIERYHEQRFRELLQNVETNHVFKKDQPVVWICRNCGNRVSGEEAPDHCPVCGYPRSYFQIPCHNY